MEFAHIPVMLDQVIAGLNIRQDGIYVDCTLGGGGHSREILKRLGPKGRLLGFDQDPNAIDFARKSLVGYEDRLGIIQANFKDLVINLEKLEINSVHGILFDLGVSSHQFDDPERGFSYNHNAALDMRMDPNQKTTAGDLINNLPEKELARLIRDYGEERWAGRIAEFICRERIRRPITTTHSLVEVIKSAIPAAARRTGPHPAKRTFQALRVYLNSELEILESSVRDGVSVLEKGGRICVISFHSLEDRIIKSTFRSMSSPCTCPKDFPVCVCGREKLLRVITTKPLTPLSGELDLNPRSRSAKLRVGERC